MTVTPYLMPEFATEDRGAAVVTMMLVSLTFGGESERLMPAGANTVPHAPGEKKPWSEIVMASMSAPNVAESGSVS